MQRRSNLSPRISGWSTNGFGALHFPQFQESFQSRHPFRYNSTVPLFPLFYFSYRFLLLFAPEEPLLQKVAVRLFCSFRLVNWPFATLGSVGSFHGPVLTDLAEGLFWPRFCWILIQNPRCSQTRMCALLFQGRESFHLLVSTRTTEFCLELGDLNAGFWACDEDSVKQR